MKILKVLASLAVCVTAGLCVGKSDFKAMSVDDRRSVCHINSLQDFYEFEDTINVYNSDYTGWTVELDTNLDFGNNPIAPIDNFNGRFNGNNHRIYNMVMDLPTEDNIGFIRVLGEDGVVENLTIYDSWFGVKSYVLGNENVGLFVGYNNGTVRHCRNAGCNVFAAGACCGGLVGYNSTTGRVDDCRVSDGSVIKKNMNKITGQVQHPDCTVKSNYNDQHYDGSNSGISISRTYKGDVSFVYGEAGSDFIGCNLGRQSNCETYVFFAW